MSLLRNLFPSVVALTIAASPVSHSTAATLKSKPDPAVKRFQEVIARIDAEAKTQEGEARVLKRLSDQLEVGTWDLKLQREASGWSLGELAAAHAFVQASSKKRTLSDIMTLQSTRASWPAIAKAFGVSLDAVTLRMKRHLGSKGS